MKERVRIIVFVLSLLFALSAFSAGPDPRELVAGEDYVPGEVLVKLTAFAYQTLSSEAQVKQFIESVTSSVKDVESVFSVKSGNEIALRHGLDRWYRVVYKGHTDAISLLSVLSENANIEIAELGYIGEAGGWPDDGLPNDEFFHGNYDYYCQWHLYNDDGLCWPDSTTPDADIDADSSWYMCIGSAEVKLAIIDTGVRSDHPDLASRIIQEDCFCSIDSCCPGGTVESHGPGSAYDSNGHGTKCAGVAAAQTNNVIGVAGVCPLCSIIAIAADNALSRFFSGDVAAAITHAADSDADVINMSIAFSWDPEVVRDAINYALDYEIVLVAAAGNYDSDWPQYPAAYDGVLGVGSTTFRSHRRWDSCYGEWVDVAAPGQFILTTNHDSTSLGLYQFGCCTSIATPQVAGEAGLLLSLHPDMPKSAIDSLIITCVDSVITEPGKPVGGKINLHKALLAAIDIAGIDLKKSITNFDIHAYPNPSAGRFSISFELARSSLCKACVYDVQGRFVATLRDGPAYEGRNELVWDGIDSGGSPATPGIYFCRIEAGGMTQTRKMILAK